MLLRYNHGFSRHPSKRRCSAWLHTTRANCNTRSLICHLWWFNRSYGLIATKRDGQRDRGDTCWACKPNSPPLSLSLSLSFSVVLPAVTVQSYVPFPAGSANGKEWMGDESRMQWSEQQQQRQQSERPARSLSSSPARSHWAETWPPTRQLFPSGCDEEWSAAICAYWPPPSHMTSDGPRIRRWWNEYGQLTSPRAYTQNSCPSRNHKLTGNVKRITL